MAVEFEHEKYWSDLLDEEFEKEESDRACVIVAVAMLDHALETLLKACLAPASSSEDELLEAIYAPISTFSARIDLTYRVGLISPQLRRDLHIIRKIRNDFAHNITSCDFDDSSVRGRIVELNRSSPMIDSLPELRKKFVKGCRGDFQMTVSWILWYLWSLSRTLSPIKIAPAEAHYRPKEQLRKELLDIIKSLRSAEEH